MNARNARALVISAIALVAYGVFFWDALERRFPGNGNAMLFLGTAALVILVSGYYLEPRQLLVRLSWAVVSPVVAAVTGYAVYGAIYYFLHGRVGPDVSAGGMLLVGVAYPYVVCDMWVLSLGLPMLSALNHLIGPSANRGVRSGHAA